MTESIKASAVTRTADAIPNTNNHHDYITVYTSDQPCNKSYRFDFKDFVVEKVEKQPSFFSGMAEKKHVPTIEDLVTIIKEISENPNQCWGLGFHPTVPVDVPYIIVSEVKAKKAVEAGTLVQDGRLYKDVATGFTVACRLKKVMSPSSYLLFDKDDGSADLGQWVLDMSGFIPNFDTVDKIVIPSNSSRVGLSDKKWHCYVKIQDPMDIYSLSGRLLSAGNAASHGVSKISKEGKELERIITDCSVFSQERIIYDGMPVFVDDCMPVEPLKVEVTKGTVLTLDTSLIKEVVGYGAFTNKKITVVDANGNKSNRTVRKSNGAYVKGKLQWCTPIEMKLNGKAVTKTMQEVVDEQLIDKYGDVSGKIRCQSTFDDRESKSFNGILRLGRDGKLYIYDNGSETTYIIGETSAEMFAGITGFIDSTANAELAKPDSFNGSMAQASPSSGLAIPKGELQFEHYKMNADGNITALLGTRDNLECLMKYYGIESRYDLIKKEVNVTNVNVVDGEEENILIAQLKSYCAMHSLPKSVVDEQLSTITLLRAFNPVTEVLSALKRTKTYNPIEELVEASPFANKPWVVIAITRWFIQCCAAADAAKSTSNKKALPKYELVLTFYGMQGTKKTSFIRALLPAKLNSYMNDGLNLNISDKDSIIEAISNWIVELGEIDSTFKKSDISELKSFLSKQKDNVRKPYAKASSKMARQTSFLGSVNEEKFLRDTTGNRRYLPIHVVDVLELPKTFDTDDLWAYVWALYLSGEQWWLSDKEEVVQKEALALHQHNPVNDPLLDFYDFESKPFNNFKTCSQILIEINLNNNASNIKYLSQMLKELKIEKVKRNYRMPPKICN